MGNCAGIYLRFDTLTFYLDLIFIEGVLAKFAK